FFFQAEDGIRDKLVTGVQTCALPIFKGGTLGLIRSRTIGTTFSKGEGITCVLSFCLYTESKSLACCARTPLFRFLRHSILNESRSEERRVGKECRTRCAAYH